MAWHNSVAAAGVMTAVLLAVSFLSAAAFLPAAFVVVLAAYLVTTISYSLWIKRQPILDVMVLAGLYSWRLVAGGTATDVEISGWLFALSGFLFTSLAFAKRYTELRLVLESSGEYGTRPQACGGRLEHHPKRRGDQRLPVGAGVGGARRQPDGAASSRKLWRSGWSARCCCTGSLASGCWPGGANCTMIRWSLRSRTRSAG